MLVRITDSNGSARKGGNRKLYVYPFLFNSENALIKQFLIISLFSILYTNNFIF